jgi:ribosome biogenesis GTPase A
MATPEIQWYPGHIAKAEKALLEQLKKVDAVLEIRDARIPIATCHPQIPQWIGNKGRVLVLNRMDMVSGLVRQAWTEWFQAQGDIPYFTNAKQGTGIEAIKRATQDLGYQMNQRRLDRDMLPRPVRAVVLGFPNVGKSALINRLLKRRVVDSARRPGITRQLRWVRISDEIELLDAPGVLPSKIGDQDAALKLAICEDIGEAAYDNQCVASAFIDLLADRANPQLQSFTEHPLNTRYSLDPGSLTGESYLHALAEHRYQGDRERAARQLLNDFRKGLLGTISLELPPPLPLPDIQIHSD